MPLGIIRKFGLTAKTGQEASYTKGTESRSHVGAGMFRLLANDGLHAITKFNAFCLSPFEWLHLPKTYTIGTGLAPGVVAHLSALAHGAWNQITNSQTAGAFQLAVWEIVSETDSQTLNIADGNFKVTYASNPGALALAQTWLTNVNSGSFQTNLSQITIFSADYTQDLLTAQVPLPGAFGSLMLGLFGLGSLRRARRV